MQRAVGIIQFFMMQDLIHNASDLLFIFTIQRSSFHLFQKTVRHIQKTLYQQRIECTAFSVLNHLQGFLVGERFFIHPFTGQRIVYVRHGNNLGADRNLFSLQAVRISMAVIPLMMPPADLVCHFDQQFFLVEGKVLQHGRAYCGMSFHHLILLRRKPSRLVQNF